MFEAFMSGAVVGVAIAVAHSNCRRLTQGWRSLRRYIESERP